MTFFGKLFGKKTKQGDGPEGAVDGLLQVFGRWQILGYGFLR